MQETREAKFNSVQELYNNGKFLTAYNEVSDVRIGDLKDPKELIFAGRLSRALGGRRLSNVAFKKAINIAPEDPGAIIYWTYSHLHRFWNSYLAIKEIEELPGATDKQRAEWWGIKSFVYANFRDFDKAYECSEISKEILPDRLYRFIELSYINEKNDKYDDALELLEESLKLKQWYYPAVLGKAELLRQTDRLEEAITYLQESRNNLECFDVHLMLANLYLDKHNYDESINEFKKSIEMSPLADKRLNDAINSGISKAYYMKGNRDESLKYLKMVDSKYHKKMAEKLEKATDDEKRVQLNVPFVRQHHVTCVPATISSLTGYYGDQIDHIELANDVCYSGTPLHRQRNWLEKRDWKVKQFVTDWDTCRELIKKDLPFAITTRDIDYGHMQGVAGVDEIIGSLIIREPSHNSFLDYFSEKFFDDFSPCGLIGMIVYKDEHSDKVETSNLPFTDVMDIVHNISMALEKHDVEKAEKLFGDLIERYPDNPETYRIGYSLSRYKGNSSQAIKNLKGLNELNPKDRWCKYNLLIENIDNVKRDPEKMKDIENLCNKKDSHPAYLQLLADIYKGDFRLVEKAVQLVKRSMKLNPLEAMGYHIHGELLWTLGKKDLSCECLKFASTLDPFDEHYAEQYFYYCNINGNYKEGLEYLTKRVEKYGQQSANPTITLGRAYEKLSRNEEAISVIKEGLKKRPDDSQLHIALARFNVHIGEFDKAVEIYKECKDKSNMNDWNWAMAELNDVRGNHEEALKHLREMAIEQPSNYVVQDRITDLTGALHGKEGILEYTKQLIDDFPHDINLNLLRARWLRHYNQYEEYEMILREVLKTDPENADCLTNLVAALTQKKAYEEADKIIDQVAQINANDPKVNGLRASIRMLQKKMPEALVEIKEALKKDIDYIWAISNIFLCCSTEEEREDALNFIIKEMETQRTYGPAIISFADVIDSYISSDKALEILKKILDLYPDIPEAWSVVTSKLAKMQCVDDAYKMINRAIEKFPYIAELYIDLALICKLRKNDKEVLTAIDKAIAISPCYSYARQLKARYYNDKYEFDKGKEILDKAIELAPMDPTNYGCYAEMYNDRVEYEKAYECLEKALELDSKYFWAYKAQSTVLMFMGKKKEAIDVAKKIIEKFPYDDDAYIAYAETMLDYGRYEEAIITLDKAAEINNKNLSVFEIKSIALCELGQFKKAIELCDEMQDVFDNPNDTLPRKAWIYMIQKKYDKAIMLCNKFLKTSPNNKWVLQNLMNCYEATKDYDHLLSTAKKLVDLNPQNPDFYNHLAHIYTLKNKTYKDAEETWERALMLDPEAYWIRNAYFDFLFDRKKYDDAEKIIAPALKSEKPSPYILARQAQIEKRRKNNDKLKDIVARILTMNAEDAWPHVHSLHQLQEAVVGVKPLVKFIKEYLENLTNVSDKGVVGLALFCERINNPVLMEATFKYADKNSREYPEAFARVVRGLCDLGLAKFAYNWWKKNTEYADSNTELWEVCGYVLNTVNKHHETINWIGKWEEKKIVSMSAILHMIFSLISLRQFDKVTLTGMKVVRTLIPDQTEVYIKVMTALCAGLQGRHDISEELMQTYSKRDLELPYYDSLNILAEALYKIANNKGKSSSSVYRNALSKFKKIREMDPYLLQDEQHRILYEEFKKVAKALIPNSFFKCTLYEFFKGC